MTASNTTFTIFSGIGFFLSVIPLSWHLRSWNVHSGTSMYLIWTALTCLVFFIDSIVWNGNAINWAPVWCDIATRIQTGFAVALPACALCIIRRVYNITVTTTPHGIRREMTIELLITVGIPVLEMVLQYVVAGHRFNIYEDYGCGTATWNTPLAYVLVYSWPLIISVVSACYGALTIRAFFRRRKQFKDLNVDIAYSNYWRLIALASTDYIITIPLVAWNISLNVSWGHVSPWVSWADTHWGYSRVFQYPRVLMDPVQVLSLELNRWVPVYCALVFFAFFGFADEAQKNYRLMGSTLAKLPGCSAFAGGAATRSPDVAMPPIHFASRTLTTQQTESRRNSESSPEKLRITAAVNECHPRFQPHPSMERPTSSSSSNLWIDVVPQVPEPALELPLRRGSVPDTTRTICLNDAHDQV